MPVPEARVPESDFGFNRDDGTPLKSGSGTPSVVEEPAKVEKVFNEPVVKEHLHPSLVEHVQPVVERDIYQTQVQPVVQTVYETENLQPEVIDRRMETEERVYKEEVDHKMAKRVSLELPRSSTDILPAENQRIVHEPVVIERIHPIVREEVVPVIERDIYQTKEIIVTHNIHEEIVQAPRYQPIRIAGEAAAGRVGSLDSTAASGSYEGTALAAETEQGSAGGSAKGFTGGPAGGGAGNAAEYPPASESVEEQPPKKGFKKFLEKVGLTHHHDKDVPSTSHTRGIHEY